jgi:hypothetical protein
MSVCPSCGKENPPDAEFCQYCNQPLETPGKPPRLLSQIQGLIPAEPVITSGRLRDSDSQLAAGLAVSSGVVSEKGGRSEPETAVAITGAVVDDITEGQVEGAEEPAFKPTPPPPSPTVVSAPAPTGGRNALAIIASIFIGVILFGSIGNLLAPATPSVSTSVKNAYTFIEILSSSSRVLLAWDYDPATQAELELLAQPILQHLQQKQVNTVFMSLRPFGPSVAADAYNLSSRLGAANNMVVASPNPVEFGFIPGETAALRSLTLSPVMASNQPVLSAQASGIRPTETIDAFDLIIEFSSDFASSQQWAEQVSVRTKKPLIVAASGAVAPALLPYEQTGQIRVLLSGYPDALAYESLIGQRGPAYQQASAQTLALLAFLGVLFFAAFRSLFSSSKH